MTKNFWICDNLVEECSISQNSLVHIGEFDSITQLVEKCFICLGQSVQVFPSSVVRRKLICGHQTSVSVTKIEHSTEYDAY